MPKKYPNQKTRTSTQNWRLSDYHGSQYKLIGTPALAKSARFCWRKYLAMTGHFSMVKWFRLRFELGKDMIGTTPSRQFRRHLSFRHVEPFTAQNHVVCKLSIVFRSTYCRGMSNENGRNIVAEKWVGQPDSSTIFWQLQGILLLKCSSSTLFWGIPKQSLFLSCPARITQDDRVQKLSVIV